MSSAIYFASGRWGHIAAAAAAAAAAAVKRGSGGNSALSADDANERPLLLLPLPRDKVENMGSKKEGPRSGARG